MALFVNACFLKVLWGNFFRLAPFFLPFCVVARGAETQQGNVYVLDSISW